MKRAIIFFITICFSTISISQDISYGFKAGLNFNRFIYDGEKDDAGNTVENITGNTGFQVGATFTWKATELMGVRGELLYSQKGGRRKYNGQSYYIFLDNDDKPIYTTGLRDFSINISQSYIDIPIMGYFKPVQWLEIYAGANVGLLVASNALGNMRYNGKSSTGQTIAEIEHELDFNYYGDKPGEVSYDNPPSTVRISGFDIAYPRSAGAYFEFSEDRGNLYKFIDTGLLGGLSVFFNRGLYVTGRVNYGMTDVTKTKADVSLVKLDDNKQFISRNDKDRNFSVQASIGFSF